MNYEILLEESKKENIYVIENANFESQSDGLISGDVIGINKYIRSNKKRACVLAEELGHFHTTYGNILSQSNVSDIKQEHRARVWAYNRLIGLTGIISCYKACCHSLNDMAEHLDITEEFLIEALYYYRSKYGTHTHLDNYVIYFEPSIGVFELI